MTWAIERAIRDGHLASISIAVVSEQDVVWEQGFGRPDPARPEVATPKTVYRIGSVSKLMTGLAIMQLVERGLVDLDKPLTTYLPEFTLLPPPSWLPESKGWSLDDITVRATMTHHAGIPGDRLAGMISTAPWDYHDLPALLAQEHATHPVGLVHSYSNNGITLLALVVEAVTEQDFESYTTQHILQPAGMPTASWRLGSAVRRRYAPPHGKGKVQRHYDLSVLPAGTLFSSVHEMANFAKTMIAEGEGPYGKVIGSSSLQKMWTPQNDEVSLDLDLKQGLVFFIDQLAVEKADTTVFHNGATLHHRASFVVLPKEKLAVVVLSNSGEAETDALAQTTAALALSAKSGFPFEEKEPASPESGDMPADEVVQAIEGTWDTGFGLVTLQRRRSGFWAPEALSFSALGADWILEPTRRGTWTPSVLLFGFVPFQPDELAALEFRFAKIDRRHVMMTVDPHGKRQLFGSQLQPSPPHHAWRDAMGTYALSHHPGDVPIFRALRLEHNDDTLRVWLIPEDEEQPSMPLALGSTSDEHGFILGLGRNRGDSVRLVENDSTSFLIYSGLRFELDPLASP